MERQIKLATLGALIGNSIFGFSFMFSRMALGVTTPFVMLMYRFILAAALLTVIACAASRRGDWRTADGGIHGLRFSLRGRNLLPLLVLGIAVFKFDPLATILAAIFPSIVIRVLQIAEAKKAPASEGSEQL